MAVDFRKKLKDAGKLWKNAKKKAAESTSEAPQFEDGRYMARLQGGEIGMSNGGRLQLTWKWKFEDEPYEGKTKYAYQGLENEDNLVFLARDLDRLGYEAPDDLAGVEEILAEIVKEKPLCRIKLRTKPGSDFQNVYIDKVFSGDEAEETEDDDADAEETEAEETESEESDSEEEEAEAEDDAEEEAEEPEDEEESEDEDDSEEEDEAEIEVGMRVEIETSKDGAVAGEIIEILPDEGKIRVKGDNGKTYKVGADKAALLTPEEPEEKPKAKAAKATAAAPKAKAGKKK